MNVAKRPRAEQWPWVWFALVMVALVAIAGLVLALFVSFGSSSTAHEAKSAAAAARAATIRQQADEFCIRQWIDTSTARTKALTPVSNRRTAAQDARTSAISREQALFRQAQRPHVNKGRLLARFNAALRAYSVADRRYNRLDRLYEATLRSHPVPVLNLRCADKRFKVRKPEKPAPVPTRTVTAHATATRTVHAPPIIRTVPHWHVVTRIRVVTIPPGHGRHR